MNTTKFFPAMVRVCAMALALALCLAACDGDQGASYSAGAISLPLQPDPVSCADYNPDQQAFFGDVHVHTALSMDAMRYAVAVRPDDAYRYGFGGSVMLPPLDAEGNSTRRQSNPRALDFMAVTDHAERLGETMICTTPGEPGHDSEFCESLKSDQRFLPALMQMIVSPTPHRYKDVCGEDLENCTRASRTIWGEIQQAANTWNSPCERTAFIAYEYSSFLLGSNYHRNVIFRNTAVQELPTGNIEAPRDFKLWDALEAECLNAGTGCDVLAIPHNSNISNGRMFSTDYSDLESTAAKAARASQRIRLEPIVEVMQHKGDSECRNGLAGVLGGTDELCDFEKFFNNIHADENGELPEEISQCDVGPGSDQISHPGPDCMTRMNYIRYALIEGLRQEQEIGVNPFQFGLSASSDTHNGTAGAVEEKSFMGHLGRRDDTREENLGGDSAAINGINASPGGLIGVWAEQNTRDSIFNAMRRKEVFGTSGPRMRLRMYAGWDFAPSLCAAPDRVSQADASGVPMGGNLPPPGDAVAPSFLTLAMADPGTEVAPGTPLQKLQMIKGWVDHNGDHQQRIIDIAGSPDNGASVDPASCETTGSGHQQLCAVWQDPEFDAGQSAVYYLRAVENPSCRWSQFQCNQFEPGEQPQACEHKLFSRSIQERAWSSPVWYRAEK